MSAFRRTVPWAVCFVLLAGGAAQAGELIIRAADFPLEVGGRVTFSVTTADGQPRGEIRAAIVGVQRLGDVAFVRQAVRVGPMRLADSWLAKTETWTAHYASFGAKHPTWRCPLPLKKGLSYEYTSTDGPTRGRVEGPEAVQVGDKAYNCLVCVEQRGAGRRRKVWIAPGVGTVKAIISADQDVTVTMTRLERPVKPSVPKGTVVLSTFDSGDPLGSPLFPNGSWSGVAGQPGPSSIVEIDPWGGAARTLFCLRWTYHTKGTWVGASVVPSGDPNVSVDISRFATTSFYIKGLTARPCAVVIHAKAANEDRRTFVNIPIQVTTEWQKITLTPQTHPQLNEIDAREVYILGLSDFSQEAAANVIWLDEVMMHLPDDRGEF